MCVCGGASDIMFVAGKKMDPAKKVRIQDEALCVSFSH